MQAYRASALGSAALLMWRGWRVIVPVVIINAAVQALVVWSLPPTMNGYVVASAIVSGAGLLLGFGLVASAALRVENGPVTMSRAWSNLRARAGRYIAWAVALLIAVVIGLALRTVPGLAILGLTPFLLLAVLDGRPRPLAVNVHVIRQRFWRWLLTVTIVGVVVLLGTVLAGFTVFFWRGGVAAALVWLVGGVLVAWITVAWALIYRSATDEEPRHGPPC